MSDAISAAEYAAMMAKKKGNKYRAEPTEVDGIRFASKAEARRYGDLRLMERAGEVTNLEVHPFFDLVVNGQKVGRYTADFAYVRVSDDEWVVEDVKGRSRGSYSEAYRLRRRIVEALYGIEVQEVES